MNTVLLAFLVAMVVRLQFRRVYSSGKEDVAPVAAIKTEEWVEGFCEALLSIEVEVGKNREWKALRAKPPRNRLSHI